MSERNSTSSDEESLTIVIDNGTGVCKAGFAGDDAPRAVFPSCVGRPKSTGQPGWQYKDTYVGDEAQPKMYPMEHGIVKNWDDMEKVWHHVFYNELRVDPEKYCVLITESPLNPKPNKEKTVEVLFEKFNVRGAIIANSAVMSLTSQGVYTGVSLESGDGGTYAVPIHEGYVIQKAVQRLDLGGRDLTDYMTYLLSEAGYSFATSSEREVVHRMKEEVCYIAQNVELEAEKYESGELGNESYDLPDGKTVTVGGWAFQTCEALFNPKRLFDLSTRISSASKSSSTSGQSTTGGSTPETSSQSSVCGIHELVYQSITQCDNDLQKDLYRNIILAGGNTMFAGFKERLTQEIGALVPSARMARVVCPPERKYSTWIGGSVYGAIARRWITKDDYVERGPSVVHDFCNLWS